MSSRSLQVILPGAEKAAVGYPFEELRTVEVVNDVVDDIEIAIVVDAEALGSWAVFARQARGRILTLATVDGRLVDSDTATVWDPVTGMGLAGELRGESLPLLPGFTVFPDDFGSFWPDGRIWSP